jgi:hypothetical protein
MDIAGRVKRRLGIAEDNTEFDDDINDFVTEAVANLYPVVQCEVAPEVVAVNTDDNSITLSALAGNLKSVRQIEIENADGFYEIYDGFTQHSDTLYLDTSFDDTTNVKVYGLASYTLGTLPSELEQVVINWAMSEFYSNLVGNSRKYNLYTQSSGARKTDNMRDTSDYYWSRGNQLLIDRAKVLGSA